MTSSAPLPLLLKYSDLGGYELIHELTGPTCVRYARCLACVTRADGRIQVFDFARGPIFNAWLGTKTEAQAMNKLVTRIRFEGLVVTALAFLTVMTFSVLVHAVFSSQPVV
jgi:hypothetical protein